MILTVKGDYCMKQNSPADLCETHVFTVRYKLNLHICMYYKYIAPEMVMQ